MTTEDRRHFVDTNVLLTASDADRFQHRACLSLLESGMAGEVSLFVSGQVFREYLVVATRPHKGNGLGMPITQALDNLAAIRQCIRILDENSSVVQRLARLIGKYEVRGKRIHDCNIAATMLEHGLKSLITLNPGDFEGIQELDLTEPRRLIPSTGPS